MEAVAGTREAFRVRLRCENRRFMTDSARFPKKRPFKSSSADDLMRPRGYGSGCLSSSGTGCGEEKNGGWEKTGVADRRKRRLFLRKKEQVFYSLFDRKIPDVLKSVLKKEKREIRVSEFNENRCPKK